MLLGLVSTMKCLEGDCGLRIADCGWRMEDGGYGVFKRFFL